MATSCSIENLETTLEGTPFLVVETKFLVETDDNDAEQLYMCIIYIVAATVTNVPACTRRHW